MFSWCSGGSVRSLSLPTQVSTTMRRPCDSTTSAWIRSLSFPSGVTKRGASQGCCASRSGVASGTSPAPGIGSSISFTEVIRTEPRVQVGADIETS